MEVNRLTYDYQDHPGAASRMSKGVERGDDQSRVKEEEKGKKKKNKLDEGFSSSW